MMGILGIPDEQEADRLVDRLKAAGDGLVEHIAAALGNELNTASNRLVDQIGGLLAAQDGWTLEIAIPAIKIPPITVRLTRPK